MVVCPKCNTWNPDSSVSCMSCGSGLAAGKGTEGARPETSSQSFEQTMDDLGKRIESGMKKLGETVEREARQEKNRLVRAWDETFGLLAPVMSGAIGCVVLLLAFLVIESFAESGEHRRFWEQLGEFLWDYVLLFIALIFMSSFQNYFNRRYRRTFRWMSPVLTAIGFAAWFWIFAQILFMAGREFQDELVRDLAQFFESMVPVVFVLALLLGYIILLVSPSVRNAVRRS